jgi:hypothetical protein
LEFFNNRNYKNHQRSFDRIHKNGKEVSTVKIKTEVKEGILNFADEKIIKQLASISDIENIENELI